MSFILTDEQAMLAETARGFFAEHAPVSRLRAMRDRQARFDRDLWRSVSELGLAGMAVAADHGGSGFGHVGVGQVMEAAGATLAATPLIGHAVIAATLLSAAGRDDLLPGLASGEVLYAVAVDELPHHAPNRLATYAEHVGEKCHVIGHKRFVPEGDVADKIILLAATPAAATVFLVDADASGLTRTPLSTLDSRAYADLTFAKTPAQPLGHGGAGAALMEAALDAGRVALAAEMLGMADALFAQTLDYLKTRTQFGDLIGSFQALQHRAAQMASELQITRSAVRAAAIALDIRGNDMAAAASLAKARASATLHTVSNEAVQMHGGIGVTDAADIGLYLKRARVAEALLGNAAFHTERWAGLSGF